MRVVLDTNILARAAIAGRGPVREVLSQLGQPSHTLITSNFVLTELFRVLHYPRLREIHKLDDEKIQTFVTEIELMAELVDLPSSQSEPAIAKDPDDNPIIQTAVLGNAEVLCTLDRHFQDSEVQAYCAERGVQILSDVELLSKLRVT